MQPDSIIPNPSNSQAFNRYTYVGNSPINFNDPSGHESVCSTSNADPECFGEDNWTPGLASYGVTLSSGWTPKDEKEILEGVETVANAFLNAYNNSPECYWDGCDGMSATSMFQYVFGNLAITNGNSNLGSGVCEASASGISCGSSPKMTGRFIAHELGHVFDAQVSFLARNYMGNASIFTASGIWVTGQHFGDDGMYKWERGVLGYPSTGGYYGVPDLYHGPRNWSDWNKNEDSAGVWTGTAINEEWADMFLNWSYGTFENNDMGQARNNWMALTISQLLP